MIFTNTVAYLLSAALAVNSVAAGIYITSPVAGTAATGGQVLNVAWQDDGKTPTLGSIGPCTVDIYTGSTNKQIFLQNLAASVDVSKASSISATINPSIGQDDSHYFVRFTSLSLKDETNSQYPYEAFSAMFHIQSMTGTFNATVLAAIDAANSSSSVITSASSTATSGSASTSGAGFAASNTKSSTHSASASSSSGSSASAAFHQAAPATLALALIGAASYLVL
ncbi:hypothetical protein I314_05751 [Cryptococcus bacillisporus CA1873]|uniref:Yeast cell wall synthesis Kre9/Knh1-like N-terminal domain-containing protein n=1 Tax=Cryptococcus bacillisporus CA1873 TaxID=1296111 RepID=A0ABR5B5I1_CRYGA|nr:hypothetical protein I314_05751 [Cryptococcus bacillisporus CA1873]|eukprot:KIR58505.1 hypothetical protein I314_05751 [Cryptococcus gattii CA1873]